MKRIFAGTAAMLLMVGTMGAMTVPALADTADNGHAALIHVGPNPASCTTVAGTASGSVNVHTNVERKTSAINVSVHGALASTKYVVDVRCVRQVGTLTTNSQGTGTAHITGIKPWLKGTFYIDISVAGGGTGAGGYGDTFIAGPFHL